MKANTTDWALDRRLKADYFCLDCIKLEAYRFRVMVHFSREGRRVIQVVEEDREIIRKGRYVVRIRVVRYWYSYDAELLTANMQA